MARLILTALMMWVLGFVGTDCGSAKAPGSQSRDTKIDEPLAAPPVVLTDKQPKGSWGVASDVLAGDEEILEVAITKVVNPGKTPVSIFVYLANTEKGKANGEPILVGNFSLYPPDRPGKFLLSAAPALRKVSATSKGGNMVLEFEMKRLDEQKAWTPVELNIAPPKWRAAEK
ncbi:MAG: hypothetical protein H7Z16_03295 [Pyrinomonadaceae bacterium]|nr:hypothetical protein [Pyrinomonadaceae bacterium]